MAENGQVEAKVDSDIGGVEICRKHRDRRSRNFFPGIVIFSDNNMICSCVLNPFCTYCVIYCADRVHVQGVPKNVLIEQNHNQN